MGWARTREKGNPMDTENHLRPVETTVHHTSTRAWIVLVIVVAVSLMLLGIVDLRECVVSIIIVLALTAIAHLLVSAGSGLWRFWTNRAAEAELQEKILRAYIAERAQARDQDPNP
jgi:membrane protein YdbS with pleckstrin-like domain